MLLLHRSSLLNVHASISLKATLTPASTTCSLTAAHHLSMHHQYHTLPHGCTAHTPHTKVHLRPHAHMFLVSPPGSGGHSPLPPPSLSEAPSRLWSRVPALPCGAVARPSKSSAPRPLAARAMSWHAACPVASIAPSGHLQLSQWACPWMPNSQISVMQ